MTLRAPPKSPNATANLVGRFIGLLILLALFAVVVWATATNQQAGILERSNPFINAPGEHLSVGEAMVHVRTLGSGDAYTVLVHDDTMVGGAILESTAQALADQGRRVIVPDLVGFGLAGRPSEPGRVYSTIGQAETLAGLLDQLGLQEADIVGFGWGGAVAADLTVTRPDLIGRLVLVNTGSLAASPTGWHSLQAAPFGLGRAVAYTREGASDRAEQLFLAECPGPADCDDPAVLEAFRRSVMVPGTSESIRARRASDTASVASDRLGEIDVPVVLVSTSDRAAVEELARRIEGSTIEVVNGQEALVSALVAG